MTWDYGLWILSRQRGLFSLGAVKLLPAQQRWKAANDFFVVSRIRRQFMNTFVLFQPQALRELSSDIDGGT